MNPAMRAMIMRQNSKSTRDGREMNSRMGDEWENSEKTRRDDRGKYATHTRSDYVDRYYPEFENRRNYENESEMRYEPYMEHGERYPYDRYTRPIYRQDETYRSAESRPMNKIGFSVGGEMERMPDEIKHTYKSDGAYMPVDEMSQRTTEKRTGYGASTESRPMTKELAAQWMHGLENSDGTHGAHWTMEQTKQVMAQRNIECDPVEFYVAMNMMYSDYCGVAKQLGINNIDFYSGMAKAFLHDKDAQPDKLSRYYEAVVQQ